MNNKPASSSPFVTKDDLNRAMLDLVSSFQSAITKALEEQARSLVNLVRQICSPPPSLPSDNPKNYEETKAPTREKSLERKRPYADIAPPSATTGLNASGNKKTSTKKETLSTGGKGKVVVTSNVEETNPIVEPTHDVQAVNLNVFRRVGQNVQLFRRVGQNVSKKWTSRTQVQRAAILSKMQP
ncbi:hypothetical protein JTE90_000142 [Oedothorax gibbosus]|uniref:Uncharacterized protein n=1 Tax=Oedothorax gibbosus TaxID=931172 RepID=A0AAV6TLD1_9ARAC|nr:hypothetical protein JTE90_000142 [Oedothorax gibbosus]